MENLEIHRFPVSGESGGGQRLDQFLAARLHNLSRSSIQRLIKDAMVFVDDQPAKSKLKLAAGNIVLIKVPPPPPPTVVQPQAIPLEILYEDEDLLVVNKAPGIVVHPAAGNSDGTLVNALLHHCRGRLSGLGGAQRPGIVHRLDKDTSGCLVAAKTDLAHQEISRQFADRETTKIYRCVVQGIPCPSSGKIENHIGRHPVNRQKMAVLTPPMGKLAVTDFEVLREGREGKNAWSLVECRLHTGRTHQIRVHMKSLGCPILGDPIYAQPSRQKPAAPRLLLHACQLGFTHPTSGEDLCFTAPLPEAFLPYSR